MPDAMRPMNDAPFFTIGLPTYNRADFLRECLAHLLQQSFPDFELVIADNCSTDHTPDVVASFSDPRIRYVRHDQNVGGFENFRFLTRRIRGQYFVVNQDDDLLHHDFLRRCHAAVAPHDDIVLYATPLWRGDLVNNMTSVLLMDPVASSTDRILSDEPFILDGRRVAVGMLHSFIFMHPALAFKSSDFLAIGGYSDAAPAVSDLITTARLLLRGRMAYDPRVGAIFRHHGGNFSHNMSVEDRRLRYADRYNPVIAELESAGVDWRTDLAADLARMAQADRMELMRTWLRTGAPKSMIDLLWSALRTECDSSFKLYRMLSRRLGLRRTIRLAIGG